MAKQIAATFSITISGQENNFSIEASGPGRIKVDPHAFVWQPTPQQQQTLDLLEENPDRVVLDQLVDLGQAMYQSVFSPAMAIDFGRAQQSFRGDAGMRIRLRITPPELAHLPWELMHDNHDFIALRSNYPIVRGVGDTSLSRHTTVRGPLKILYAWADPEDQPALNLQGPAQTIGKLLADNKRIKYTPLENATLESLRSALLDDYHILCFAGHGTHEHIYLESEQGHQKVSAQTLARELEGKPTRLVFLAACETSEFAQSLAAQAGIPAVAAMQYEVNDDEANRLTARFFETLAAFRPVDAALSEARKSIADESRTVRDVFAPVMYLQAETSNLFQRARNWITWVASAAAVVAAIIAIIFFSQAGTARQTAQLESTQRANAQATAVEESTQRANAQATAASEAQNRATQQAIAEDESTRANSLVLIDKATEYLNDGNPYMALTLALQANQIPNPPIEAQRVLVEIAYQPGLIKRIDGSAFAYKKLDEKTTLIITSTGLMIWTPDDNKLQQISEFDWDISLPCAVNSSGTQIASAKENIIYVWNLNNGKLDLEIELPENEKIRVLEYSPDSKYILLITSKDSSSGIQESISLWDIVTGIKVKEYSPDTITWDATFLPDGNSILIVGNPLSMLIDLHTGQTIKEFPGGGYTSEVTLNSDGKYAVLGEDTNSNLINTENGEIVWTLYDVNAKYAAFSKNGQTLLLGPASCYRRVTQCPSTYPILHVDPNTGEILNELIGHENGINLLITSDDGKKALSSDYGHIFLWDIYGNGVLDIYKADDIAMQNDGTVITTHIVDGVLSVMDMTHEHLLFSESTSGQAMAINDSGTIIATTRENHFYFYDIVKQIEVTKLDIPSWDSFTGEFSKTGKLFAVYDLFQGRVKVWDIETKNTILDFNANIENASSTPYIGNICFSPDDTKIAIGINNYVSVIDLKSKTEIYQIRASEDELISDVIFSPSGRFLLTSASGITTDNDQSVNLWDVPTGKLLLTLIGHEKGVHSVEFSPNENYIITSSRDGTTRLWTITGQEFYRYEISGDRFGAIETFDVQSNSFALHIGDSQIILLRMPSSVEDLIDWTINNRYMITCEERDSYNINPLCDE